MGKNIRTILEGKTAKSWHHHPPLKENLIRFGFLVLGTVYQLITSEDLFFAVRRTATSTIGKNAGDRAKTEVKRYVVQTCPPGGG